MSNTTRFRPDGLEASTGGGGSKWLGYCAVGILDWQDKSSDFDWADVYLVGTLKVSDSQYTQEFKLAGSFDKEPNGNIKTCTLLKRLYWLFDAIGFDGGPNVTGEMVDADGNAVDLVNHFTSITSQTLSIQHWIILRIYTKNPVVRTRLSRIQLYFQS